MSGFNSVGLFAFAHDRPIHLSVFGKETAALRDQSVARIHEAMANESMPDDVREKRTRKPIDKTLDLIARLIPIAPLFAPFAAEIGSILDDAELVTKRRRK